MNAADPFVKSTADDQDLDGNRYQAVGKCQATVAIRALEELSFARCMDLISGCHRCPLVAGFNFVDAPGAAFETSEVKITLATTRPGSFLKQI